MPNLSSLKKRNWSHRRAPNCDLLITNEVLYPKPRWQWSAHQPSGYNASRSNHHVGNRYRVQVPPCIPPGTETGTSCAPINVQEVVHINGGARCNHHIVKCILVCFNHARRCIGCRPQAVDGLRAVEVEVGFEDVQMVHGHGFMCDEEKRIITLLPRFRKNSPASSDQI